MEQTRCAKGQTRGRWLGPRAINFVQRQLNAETKTETEPEPEPELDRALQAPARRAKG